MTKKHRTKASSKASKNVHGTIHPPMSVRRLLFLVRCSRRLSKRQQVVFPLRRIPQGDSHFFGVPHRFFCQGVKEKSEKGLPSHNATKQGRGQGARTKGRQVRGKWFRLGGSRRYIERLRTKGGGHFLAGLSAVGRGGLFSFAPTLYCRVQTHLPHSQPFPIP